MESRTWFFNFTVLKKNITRFAPVWIVYSVLLLLPKLSNIGLGLLMEENVPVAMMTLEFHTIAITNFIYAMVCAMLLFGDLFRSRMCNALYALPIRREGWFITNVVTGLLFSFVPNLGLTLLMLPAFGSAWPVPLLWFAVTTLQFFFFFGSAVLAAYCTGKRFAMALAYALLNLFSMLAYWLLTSIYEPLLYGVVIGDDLFMLLCPLMKLVEFDYVSFDFTEFPQNMSVDWAIGSGWGYLAVCVVLGLAFFGLALLCCRRRNLEAAGDFVAFRCLKPVILVLYTLLVGMVLRSFYIPPFLGFSVGFFTGLMLLERSVKVFRKKTFLGIGIFLGVYLVSLAVLISDLLGIIGWVPQVQEIQSVRMQFDTRDITLEEPEDIEGILTIHRHGLAERYEEDPALGFVYTDEELTIVKLDYTTKSGSTRTREYYIAQNSDVGPLLEHYKNMPEAVLGEIYTLGADIISVTFQDRWFEDLDFSFQQRVEIESFKAAILEDCLAERIYKDSYYVENSQYLRVYLKYYHSSGVLYSRNLIIFEGSESVVAWLKDHGIDFFDE